MAVAAVLVGGARALLGVAWGGLLVVCGLWLLGGLRIGAADGGEVVWMFAPGRTEWWAGLMAIAAGEFVFLCVACDRLCPMKSRRLPDWLQLCCAGGFVVCLVGVVGSFLGVLA
ncbi:MAG: hypothetical protein J0L61_09705 [Planctomycetes bacterium]|nr:hypothetical protein [Planctomycetota bacterium]